MYYEHHRIRTLSFFRSVFIENQSISDQRQELFFRVAGNDPAMFIVDRSLCLNYLLWLDIFRQRSQTWYKCDESGIDETRYTGEDVQYIGLSNVWHPHQHDDEHCIGQNWRKQNAPGPTILQFSKIANCDTRDTSRYTVSSHGKTWRNQSKQTIVQRTYKMMCTYLCKVQCTGNKTLKHVKDIC